MKLTDPLFELIKSLTGNEKRYFKLFAERHTLGKKNNYVTVFETIEQLEVYDEKKLAANLLKSEQISNYRFYKHYVHKLILKSLHAFHSENSIEAVLREQLHCIEILMERKLFRQCGKLIRKTRQLAIDNEKHIYLLDVLRLEMNMAISQGYQHTAEKQVDALHADFFDVIHKVENLFEYRQVQNRVFMNLYRNARMNDRVRVQKLQKIMKNVLFENDKLALSKSALSRLYRCRSAYYFLMCDYKKVVDNSRREIAMLESDSVFLNSNSDQYFTAYCNLFVSKTYLGNFHEIPSVLKKMKEITENKKQFQVVIFNLEMTFYNNTGRFNKTLDLYEKNKKLIDELIRVNKRSEIEFYFSMAYAHMGAGNYKVSNNYLNSILNDTAEKLNEDMYSLSLIVSLINYYEMDKSELLEYMTRSAHRFLSNKTPLFKFENVLLKFIRKKLLNLNNPDELLKAFNEVKRELVIITKDKFENKSFLRFDFISWLESKTGHKSFSDIVRTKTGF